MRISFITLTNKGYLPYTTNCLASLKKISIYNLKCYAIGEYAYKQLLKNKIDATYIQDETNTNFQSYRQGNWADIILYKFQIIHDNLKNNDFVCFTDGDIVFKEALFLDYCKNEIGEADLLIQNDTQDDTSRQNLCSGFMFIRSNKTTLKYFDPAYVKANSIIAKGWGDQVYINQNKEKFNYKVLPLALFPNGKYYLENHISLAPYLIHFNWLIGHKKSAQIVRLKECYSFQLWRLYFKEVVVEKYKNGIKRRLNRYSAVFQ